jgi:serine/threonine protein kinase
LLSDFGRSNIIDQRGFTSSNAIGSARYTAPELLVQGAESDESDNAESSKLKKETKESDVYSFSIVGVVVSLFQMTHIPVFQGHHHRFYLEKTLTPRYLTIIGSSCEFQRVYDQIGKNMNCPNYMRRYGTYLSVAGFIFL